jgi:hypothetical protein
MKVIFKINLSLVGWGALVPIGKGIGLSGPTGTNDERQNAPLLVLVERIRTKGDPLVLVGITNRD